MPTYSWVCLRKINQTIFHTWKSAGVLLVPLLMQTSDCIFRTKSCPGVWSCAFWRLPGWTWPCCRRRRSCCPCECDNGHSSFLDVCTTCCTRRTRKAHFFRIYYPAFSQLGGARSTDRLQNSSTARHFSAARKGVLSKTANILKATMFRKILYKKFLLLQLRCMLNKKMQI